MNKEILQCSKEIFSNDFLLYYFIYLYLLPLRLRKLYLSECLIIYWNLRNKLAQIRCKCICYRHWTTNCNIQIQKRSPEVFYEKGFFKKFRIFHRKTPVLESLFNKVASLKIYFDEQLWTIASADCF